MGKKITQPSFVPVILCEGNYTASDLNTLRADKRVWSEHDIYESQSQEFFKITHPHLLKMANYQNQLSTFLKERTAKGKSYGNWIYFPWNGRLVHMVSEEEYATLRTNRNRNLITVEEQEKLRNFRVGIIGLSVGSNVATTLAYSGIADMIKLSEFDTLETTNLNRIRARVDQIGMRKIDITAQQIYEVNPYAKLVLSPELTKDTLKNFVIDAPKPQLIFEIIDSFEMKIHLRNLARKHHIPVIMITNLGDRLLVDVERYDLDKNIEFFNGRAGKVPKDIIERPDKTSEDQHHYAVELAGVEHIPQKALDSVKEIGKTLAGRPQLASTVTVASGLSVYLTRKIALRESLPSASWLVNFDEVFTKENAL